MMKIDFGKKSKTVKNVRPSFICHSTLSYLACEWWYIILPCLCGNILSAILVNSDPLSYNACDWWHNILPCLWLVTHYLTMLILMTNYLTRLVIGDTISYQACDWCIALLSVLQLTLFCSFRCYRQTCDVSYKKLSSRW